MWILVLYFKLQLAAKQAIENDVSYSRCFLLAAHKTLVPRDRRVEKYEDIMVVVEELFPQIINYLMLWSSCFGPGTKSMMLL
jgi:hypothetical protein